MTFSLVSYWCLIALFCSPLYIEAQGKRITTQTMTFILPGKCLEYPENQQFYRQNHALKK